MFLNQSRFGGVSEIKGFASIECGYCDHLLSLLVQFVRKSPESGCVFSFLEPCKVYCKNDDGDTKKRSGYGVWDHSFGGRGISTGGTDSMNGTMVPCVWWKFEKMDVAMLSLSSTDYFSQGLWTTLLCMNCMVRDREPAIAQKDRTIFQHSDFHCWCVEYEGLNTKHLSNFISIHPFATPQFDCLD